jgi:hypothetical protein
VAHFDVLLLLDGMHGGILGTHVSVHMRIIMPMQRTIEADNARACWHVFRTHLLCAMLCMW